MRALEIGTVIGLVAVVVLFFVWRKRHSQDAVAEMMAKRRGSSKLVTRADFVQGLDALPVALALTESAVFYENPDFQAQFDLDRIDEIEYDDELSTGKAVENARVLRLRSHGQTFEFILNRAEAERWTSTLPMRRLGQVKTS